MCEYSDAIKLPNQTPLLRVSRSYRLTHFWLAEEVNKEVNKEVASSVLIRTITYYDNTK